MGHPVDFFWDLPQRVLNTMAGVEIKSGNQTGQCNGSTRKPAAQSWNM
jgi:hypothetical protein